MSKDFDEFIAIMNGDEHKANVQKLKDEFLDSEVDIETSIENMNKYDFERDMLRLRAYHDWLTSDSSS